MAELSKTKVDYIHVCGADFNAVPRAGFIGDEIVFTDMSVCDIVSWNWNFGEGASPATALGIGPHEVRYSNIGRKTVSLTVYFVEGGSNTITKEWYITILGRFVIARYEEQKRRLCNLPPEIYRSSDVQ